MFQVLVGIFVVITTFYLWVKWRYSYWTKKGVTQVKPDFPFGNFRQTFIGKNLVSTDVTVQQLYDEFRQKGNKYGGFYILLTPIFMPVDNKLIDNIFQKDFAHFTDHALPFHHKKDILSDHLFSLEGEKWKKVRSSLSPTFTSGKMKFMFDIVNHMGEILEQKLNTDKPLDIKDTAACFTTDVIANCAFGLDPKCMDNPDVQFRQYGRDFFKPRTIQFLIEFIFPWNLLGNLGHKIAPKHVDEFFINVMEQTLKQREEHSIYRKDFVQLLLELKNKENKEESLSHNDILASMFVFYLAGFETSSTATSSLMYEIAKKQTIQDKLREEINTIFKKYDGKLTYEGIQEMKYAHQCIEESLRMYPPVATLTRKCTKTYKIPDSDVVLEKGTNVMLSTLGIQRDPAYYTNPNEFNPEHFSEENIANRPHCSFVAFGEGPRKCIGLRFGFMQAKIALAYLLRNHKFTLNKNTPTELTIKANTPTISFNEALILDVTRV